MRRSHRVRLTFILLALPILAVIWARPATPRAAGPLPSDAYVWQRAWTDGLKDAIAAHGPSFSRLVLLGAQISWTADGPRVFRVPVDFASLAQSKTPVGLAIRVASIRGPLDPSRGQAVADLARAIVAESRAGGLKLAELQIDFDAAESQLDGYRAWLETIRQQVGDLPVTITALPSWLDAPGFASLAQAAGGYVLQVHSFETPTLSQKMTLCDPARARSAVERAGRLGVPFRVALPTYSYRAAFDASGKFLGVRAEGQSGAMPESAQVRLVRADANELAELVRGWSADRPAAMRGLIWYRLPVEGDTLNWRWPTLAAVMAGRTPVSNLQATARPQAQHVKAIEVTNIGEADELLGTVVAGAPGAATVAADGLEGFSAAWDSAGARFTPHGAQVLGAGEARTIGWIRTDRDQEVKAHVER